MRALQHTHADDHHKLPVFSSAMGGLQVSTPVTMAGTQLDSQLTPRLLPGAAQNLPCMQAVLMSGSSIQSPAQLLGSVLSAFGHHYAPATPVIT